MVKKIFRSVGVVVFAQLLCTSTLIGLMPKITKAQTLQEYGVTNKDKVEDAIDYLEWIDAAHIKLRFKVGKEFVFTPSGIKDNGGSDLRDERLSSEPGFGINYGKVEPGYACNAEVRFDINENKDVFEKQSTQLTTANVDIDFKPNADGDCDDGNEPDITVRRPELSIAYFKWTAPNQISTVDGEFPGSFTKGTTEATIDGIKYEVFLSDREASATECRDKLVLNRATNQIMWYQLGSSDGNPPDDVSTTCGYNNENDKDSFPRNNYLWGLANTAEAVKDVPLSTGLPQDEKEKPSCTGSIDNGFGWIICPALEGIDGFINGAEAVISSKLAVNSSTFTGDSGDSLRRTWLLMARFASGLLSIIALIMIVSTALGFDFVSAYTIKKVLPRIVIGAIGMWLSWPLVVAYINFMNDLGRGIASLMYSAFPDAQNLGLRDIVAVVAESSGVVTDIGSGLIFSGLIVAGGAAAATAGLVGILAGALTVATAILVGVFSLAVREILIIMSVIFAPIAIASWILPNTNKLWKFWSSNLNKLLFMFPMIMALFAGAKIMAKISAEAINANPGSGFLEMLFPLIIFVSPLFFLPKLFKSAGGILTGVTAAAGKFGNKATGGWQNTLKSAGAERTKRRDYQKAVNQRNRQNNGVSVFGRPLPGSAASARAMNRLRTGQAVVPMTRGARLDARQAASRTAQATIIDRQKQLEEVIGNDVEAKKAIASGVSYEQLERTNRDLAARMKASGSAIHLGNRDAQAAATLSLASSGFATEEHIRKMAESFVDDKQTASALVSSATRAMKDKGNQTVGALKYNYGDGKIGYERVAEAKDASGNVVYETDASGNVVYETDAAGNAVYERDAAGNAVIDSQGNPVPKRKAKTEKVIHTETGSLDESGQPTDQTYIETRRLAIRNALGSMSAVDLASLAIEGDGSGFKDKGINEALRNDTALATRILNDESAKLTAGQRQVLINLGAVPETKEPQEVRIVP